MAGQPNESDAEAPRRIAPGVHWVVVGRGLMRSNVYFVRSEPSWMLVDAGSADCAPVIRRAAESLFGEGAPPVAILATHGHPDHVGSARDLARLWDCPVWVHPDELPMVRADLATIRKYASPLDRWVVLPLLHLKGSQRAEALVARASLGDVARSFDPSAGVPGLPDWEAVPTPGHTPGHVAFYRRHDRVLISGDALVTMNLNSPWGLLRKSQKVSGPPRYATWDWRVAKESVARLAELEPMVVAGGHGIPMSGPQLPGSVRAFSARL
jgi:glyoxylase-like metal-dependent hydrolase (beta-lactamase superfamily II)